MGMNNINMPTIRQKTAIQKMVENGGNATKAMREAGYSDASTNNPSSLTQSKGYKEILKECGLTEELVIKSLVADIKAKPQNRTRELHLGAEILNMKKRDVQDSGLPIPLLFNISWQEARLNKLTEIQETTRAILNNI